VSTIGLGLGYNEDLMSRLADRSDGNHSFVENPRDLARIFENEFGELLSASAREVVIRVDCAPGARPVRVIGRHADIIGSTAHVTLNQVYAGRRKYILVELEVPPGREGDRVPVATVTADYLDLERGRRSSRRETWVLYSADPAAVESAANTDVLVSVVEQTAVERNELAISLRDRGEVKRAESVLLSNIEYVDENARRYDSDRLRSLAENNQAEVEELGDDDWGATRKRLLEQQQVIRQQQSRELSGVSRGRTPTPEPEGE
jgi:Ca-activated chloride channel family protein